MHVAPQGASQPIPAREAELPPSLPPSPTGRPAPGDPTPPPPPGAPDHWAVRDRAASLVHRVCVRFGDPYYNVQPRVSKTMLKALLDPGMPLTTHYGACLRAQRGRGWGGVWGGET